MTVLDLCRIPVGTMASFASGVDHSACVQQSIRVLGVDSRERRSAGGPQSASPYRKRGRIRFDKMLDFRCAQFTKPRCCLDSRHSPPRQLQFRRTLDQRRRVFADRCPLLRGTRAPVLLAFRRSNESNRIPKRIGRGINAGIHQLLNCRQRPYRPSGAGGRGRCRNHTGADQRTDSYRMTRPHPVIPYIRAVSAFGAYACVAIPSDG